MADITVCIYCPAESEKPFSKAEHVLPQAFGKFRSREGNLTLHNVCPECNAYFGKHLEQHFGRDSGDALLRLLTGLKPAEEASEIGGRRLTFRIEEPGEFHGAWVTFGYSEERREPTLELSPQAGFQKEFEPERRWYRLCDITAERRDEFTKCSVQVIGSVVEVTAINERLESFGARIQDSYWSDTSPQPRGDSPIPVEVRCALDDTVFRTVAKIAFNYLVKVTQDRVPSFVRRSEFDDIREYIRHGTKPRWDVVKLSEKRMLLGDTGERRVTNGHLLGVSWPDPRQVPIGKVSLFNQITYVVQFTDQVPGIWWELDSGHHFDIQTREMTKMGTVNPMVLRASQRVLS